MLYLHDTWCLADTMCDALLVWYWMPYLHNFKCPIAWRVILYLHVSHWLYDKSISLQASDSSLPQVSDCSLPQANDYSSPQVSDYPLPQVSDYPSPQASDMAFLAWYALTNGTDCTDGADCTEWVTVLTEWLSDCTDWSVCTDCTTDCTWLY